MIGFAHELILAYDIKILSLGNSNSVANTVLESYREWIGRKVERKQLLLSYLVNQHSEKKNPSQNRMGIIWYKRDLVVVYRKVPKAFGLEHSCSAESKSDAGLYYWGKQSEAKPRRGWSCYIRHHLHSIKNAITPIVSCSSGCNCSWNKGTEQNNQNEDKFQTVQHWNVGKYEVFFQWKKNKITPSE